MTRQQVIYDLKEKGTSINDIASKFTITPERVRQILKRLNYAYCKKHNRYVELVCEYCVIEKAYPSKIKNAKLPDILKEIASIKKNGKHRENVIKKKLIIALLHDKLNFSFSAIARFFSNDHTTIIHLYNN